MKHLAEKPVRKASVSSLFGLPAAVIVLVALLHCPAFADEGSDFSRARAAASAADSFEAQSLLEDYIDRYPEGSNAPNAKYLLGRILYRRADYSGAAQAFSATIEQHPQWKYIDNIGLDQELYNLRDDPYEMRNVIDTAPKNLVRKLQDRLHQWMRQTGDFLPP